MYSSQDTDLFLEQGYFHARGVLATAHLEYIRSEFNRIWDSGRRCNQHELLKHPAFIELIEHPPILEFHRALFAEQVQLLQYDFLRQGPGSSFPLRSWHRDFVFPGDTPLSVNTILYLDEMTDDRGPTYVVPGTQYGRSLPPRDRMNQPLPGEEPIYASAGDAVFINAAIWHSGSRNRSEGLRRAIYLYYGYWWLKPYEADQQRPWQCLEGASEQRLQLLGVKMPEGDLHMYGRGAEESPGELSGELSGESSGESSEESSEESPGESSEESPGDV